MIVKSISLLLCAVLFSACSSDDITDFVDKYTESEVPAVVDNSADTASDNTPLSAQIVAMLAVHNKARADVGIASKITWSSALAKDAQSYADTLARSGEFKHDPKNHKGYANGVYGENLYAAYPSKPSLKKATQAWVDEKEFYTYGNIGDSSTCVQGQQCGHYTQIIWKDTSKVGCATSRYSAGRFKDGYVIVCKYQSAGNVIGRKPY